MLACPTTPAEPELQADIRQAAKDEADDQPEEAPTDDSYKNETEHKSNCGGQDLHAKEVDRAHPSRVAREGQAAFGPGDAIWTVESLCEAGESSNERTQCSIEHRSVKLELFQCP